MSFMARKAHLEHPTQAVACGGNAAFVGPALSADKFRAAPEQCKRCAKVLAAADAGRPHFRGYDDGAGDTGAR